MGNDALLLRHRPRGISALDRSVGPALLLPRESDTSAFRAKQKRGYSLSPAASRASLGSIQPSPRTCSRSRWIWRVNVRFCSPAPWSGQSATVGPSVSASIRSGTKPSKQPGCGSRKRRRGTRKAVSVRADPRGVAKLGPHSAWPSGGKRCSSTRWRGGRGTGFVPRT